MTITAVNVFQVDLPLRDGSYRWSGGKSVAVFDSTVVELVTDSGLSGWGEACPLGPVYLPAYAAGCRTGIAQVAPALLGRDPRHVAAINRVMDRTLQGHPYVKSALDVACWDLLGKACGEPVCTLLGGRFGDRVALYRAISQGTPAEMADRVARFRGEGYRSFQLKVGGPVHQDLARLRAVAARLEPGDLLIADANTGWLSHQALQVVHGARDLPVYVEQPCASYAECLVVRRATPLPFILDESITDLRALQRAAADGAVDAINVKISKFGGLTRARLIRDVCVELGIPMIIEDSWGGDIITAAIAHLAHSTPPALRLAATDFNSYVTVSTAAGAPQREHGTLAAGAAPGLGVAPRREVLGGPVLEVT